MIKLNKKSTIGTTMTWILATILVIAAILLFFGMLIPQALNQENLDSSIIYGDSTLLSVKSFLLFLNSDSDNNYLIKEDILLWAQDNSLERKNRIEKKLWEFIEFNNFECYYFKIEGRGSIEKGNDKFIEKSILLKLPTQNLDFANINLYGGNCLLV